MTADAPNLPVTADDLPAFTLHVAGEADLLRLGRSMGNCLASYGRGRIRAGDRIVEVRQGDETRYAVHIRYGRIVMFEGAGNRPPASVDVPVVQDLLERSGLLHATRRESERSGRTSPTRGTPRRRATGDDGEPGQPRPRRPAPRPGISVQALAADLLRPPTPGRTEWPELAAALWASGWLAVLPDPTQTVYEQIVRDLAVRIATGDDRDLPQGQVPSPDRVRAVRDGLLAGRSPTHHASWQRERMAEVLSTPLLP